MISDLGILVVVHLHVVLVGTVDGPAMREHSQNIIKRDRENGDAEGRHVLDGFGKRGFGIVVLNRRAARLQW